jgi:hypothetical protein
MSCPIPENNYSVQVNISLEGVKNIPKPTQILSTSPVNVTASRKATGSSPDEVDFFKLTYSFRPHYGPGVDSASNRNEYQESLKIKKPGGDVRPVRRADNLAAIYSPSV